MSPLSDRNRRIVLIVVLIVASCFAALKMHGLQALKRDIEKHHRVDSDIRAIAAELERFKSDTGDYPSADQRLAAVPPMKDPWGSDYIYRYPGKHHRDGYDLFSAGVDLRPDTPDDEWGQQ